MMTLMPVALFQHQQQDAKILLDGTIAPIVEWHQELHRASLDVGGAVHVMQFLDHRDSRLISRSLCERQIFMTRDTCGATRLR
ncbi:unnamed protein product [Lasius platythorax]|uniref:Uncharacterized protein n=1 Tax=Lasius platythorax TaxID=488582 RepID=A0AAV2NNJ5_9HYME